MFGLWTLFGRTDVLVGKREVPVPYFLRMSAASAANLLEVRK